MWRYAPAGLINFGCDSRVEELARMYPCGGREDPVDISDTTGDLQLSCPVNEHRSWFPDTVN
jgi:hypothetical protein